MTTDLTILALTAVLAVLTALTYTAARVFGWSLAWAVGNRDTTPQDPAWVARTERGHRNLLESLTVFTVLVLIAHVTGRSNATTALGAEIFLAARVAYGVVYALGIPWLRTGVWVTSVAGMVLILTQLW